MRQHVQENRRWWHCPCAFFSVLPMSKHLKEGMNTMAEHLPSGPVEMGAEMDYAEHDRTYNLFLGMTKYGIIANVALLAAMAFGFFTSAGFISAFLLFVAICALGAFLLK